jgi:hypothetical protein
MNETAHRILSTIDGEASKKMLEAADINFVQPLLLKLRSILENRRIELMTCEKIISDFEIALKEYIIRV